MNNQAFIISLLSAFKSTSKGVWFVWNSYFDNKKIIMNIRVILVGLFFCTFGFAATIGDVVSNQASASYKVAGAMKSTLSNEVNTTITGTTPTLEFWKYDPNSTDKLLVGEGSYQDASGNWVPLDTPTLPNGSVLDTTNSNPLSLADYYFAQDLAIIKVQDKDRDTNPNIRDTLVVTLTSPAGDTETITLLETTPNSGIFVGYIPLVDTADSSKNGKLYVKGGDSISVSYLDQTTILFSVSAPIKSNETTNIWVEKSVNKPIAGVGDMVKYTINIHNEATTVASNVVWYDALPHGIKYQKETFKVDGILQEPTISSDGKELSYGIPSIASKGSVEITFLAQIGAVRTKEIINQTWATDASSTKTNIATATTLVQEELYQHTGFIVGQIYESKFKKNRKGHGVANVRVYLQNGTYVLTDEKGKYHFEGLQNGTYVVQVDKDMLPLGYEMDSCGQQSKFGGNNFSQFVDLKFGGLKRADFCLQKTDSTPSASVVPKESSDTQSQLEDKMPIFGVENLKDNTTQILWPPEVYVPSIPAISLAVRYPKKDKAELWLNGKKVSMLNFDGKTISPNEDMVIDRYRGVDLLSGVNKIEIRLFDSNGNLYETLYREIAVASTPIKMTYIPELSKVVADGIEPCVIAVKMVDSANKPIRAGVTGTFSVDPPHKSIESIKSYKNNPLAKVAQNNRYIVEKDGIAYIALQPTTQSGEVVINFPLEFKNEVIKAWLKPGMRKWIMVGFAEGTVGFDTLKKKGQQSRKKEVIQEGESSFFAKGTIKGEWLATIAYDTTKETKNQRYFGEIDPNSYYTIYHDNSEQNYDAPSTKKLYLKLEKDEFNILFGDFNTGFTTTELAEYSRIFTGVKSQYHSKHIEAKAFAAHTDQVYQREEFRGDGTSGYYRLKRQQIIENSEIITIEIRDRYRSEITISQKQLMRYRDYDIDYAMGRISFKEPIYSTDLNFNPQYITARYETRGDGGENYTYGGRVVGKLKEGDIEVGSTYINEDLGTQQNQLMGLDAKVRLTPSTTLKLEYAKTTTDKENKSITNDAKFAELEHLSNGLYLRGYYREQDNSFGLGQLSEDLNGTRRIGLDAVKSFDNRFSIKATGYRNSDTKIDNHEDVLEVKAAIDETLWSLYAGYRYAKNSDTKAANQILLGGSYALFDQKLRLLAALDKTLGANEDQFFPDRTMVGANYSLASNVELFGAYEWLENDNKKIEQGRVGTRFTPWSGMSVENTTLSQFENDTTRLYNTTGFRQSYQLTPKIWLSGGYERGVLLQGDASRESDVFDAYRLGGSYRGNSFSGTLNAEYKDGSIESKKNFALGLYTQPSDNIGLAFNVLSNHTYDDVNSSKTTEASLSFAYRPEQTEWIIFDKLEYVYQKEDMYEHFNTEKFINNLHANYMPNDDLEISFQHGIKYTVDAIDEFEYDGFVQLFGLDVRYEITDKIDIGFQGSTLVAHNANNTDYGLGAYAGYNVFENLWIHAGYNFQGFRDDDFSLQTYRHEGPFVRLRMKFDQHTIKGLTEMIAW